MRISASVAGLLTAILPLAVAAQSSPASFAYLLQADAADRTKPAAVAQLASCGRDWIIVDSVFNQDQPWEREDIETIRAGKAGRQVVAYISIGEAEDYRFYWSKEWGSAGKLTTAAPSWLGAENVEWKGNYKVQYWRPEWQELILAVVDSVTARGFDGVYLDIVDGFESFEQDGKDYVSNRVNPQTKQSFRRDMVDWVKLIAARARAKNPGALVIPQNGSQLLAHADFLKVISAIGIEDMFTEGDRLQSRSHTAEVLETLKPLLSAHKPVLLVEYAQRADRRALAIRRAQENGMIWLTTDRPLETLGLSGAN